MVGSVAHAGPPPRSSVSSSLAVDAHGQPAAGHPDPQQFAVGDLGGIAHQRAVGALDDRVAALQGRGGGERGHPRAGVLEVALGALHPVHERAPGPGAQRQDVVLPAVQQPVGGGQHRPGAHRLQPALLLLQPAGEQVPGAGAQAVDQPPLLADLGHDPVRGVGGGGGADVGDVVDQRRVGLVADGGDHRRAGGGDRPDQPLVGEGQQVLDRAAAAGDDDDLDGGVGVQPAQPVDDVRRRPAAPGRRS